MVIEAIYPVFGLESFIMSNERILLVDDDPSFTDLLRGYLETAGFEVLDARDASTAIKLTKTPDPATYKNR